MSAPTLDLKDYQVRELAMYAIGPLKRRPSRNLLRRNMLMHVGRGDSGTYAITEYGRSALAAAASFDRSGADGE